MAADTLLPKEALEFFKREGARGGKARAKKLSKAQRSASAKKASRARWRKAKQKY